MQFEHCSDTECSIAAVLRAMLSYIVQLIIRSPLRALSSILFNPAASRGGPRVHDAAPDTDDCTEADTVASKPGA
jgi:hypothetical protein